MTKYTETRSLSTARLRKLCVNNNWYTLGTNEEYLRLFSLIRDDEGGLRHLTTDDLAEIAQDIWIHSDIKDYTPDAIMAELAVSCYYFFDPA